MLRIYLLNSHNTAMFLLEPAVTGSYKNLPFFLNPATGIFNKRSLGETDFKANLDQEQVC